MAPEIGARVLAMAPDDRVLLLLSIDPDFPERRWWDLPGGKTFPKESVNDAAKRELLEETGIVADELGPHLWDREVRFVYRGKRYHRRDSVFLARVEDTTPTHEPTHTANEQANLIESRWWTLDEMTHSSARFLPPNLPDLVSSLLRGELRAPLMLRR
ncbi:NUDIX hydrolase [Saccharopolyspora hattusasensis]|uniref:NUDIX hydrolase n=1 Tax=Saccharopolyspora hattusasensis TaxID=1128679 RepID=UPI003D973527